MAKPIYMTNDEVEKMVEDFKTQLLKTKSFGSINIKKTISSDARKATVRFTPEAWAMVNILVAGFDTEVQWHGCVRRVSENEFEIYDIIVPPHTVSAATVTSDDEKYSEWLNGLDDEVFNSLRFHGHSHVNMGCAPSGTDMTYRKNIVTQLPSATPDSTDDSFYIFLIFNKKGEWTGQIYDLKYNALYDTDEISVEVRIKENLTLKEFLAEAKKVAVKEQPKTQTSNNFYTASNVSLTENLTGVLQRNENKKSGSDSFYDKYPWLRNGSCSCDDDDDITSPFYAKGY
jgi:hypothetical protein